MRAEGGGGGGERVGGEIDEVAGREARGGGGKSHEIMKEKEKCW